MPKIEKGLVTIMRIKIKFQKENILWTAVAAILAGALYAVIGFSIWVLPGFIVLFFAIRNLDIQLNEKFAWLWTILLIGLGSIFTAHHVQYLLLDETLRSKISDTKMMLNVLCCLVVFLIVQIFSQRADLTCVIAHLILMILAGINYFVYLFRGNEFIFSDLKSIQTGLSVAGNYQFVLDERAGYVILISAIYIIVMRRLPVPPRHRILTVAVCMSLSILSGIYLAGKTEHYVTETWEQKGSYRNGYILNFVLSVRDSFVNEPEGYSTEKVKALEEQYAGDGASYVEEAPENPTIIVIMSESYADLSVIGDFTTNQEITPFYNSLTENTLKGYAVSSVYGAKTPNSEWEYMTGNSMAFLPGGSVVYQQYISDTPTSIVSNLKNTGYTCVAMHPYYETGWSRNAVYPDMGFDEMYFINDFDQTKILRKYITDQELYEKIIDRYEDKSSKENLFIMSISMQNHGGYTEKYDNFKEEVRMLGLNFPDVNQYLSLLHESDKALEYLISYFENVDEPVEIVFFGDHQPSLSTRFYPHLNGKGLSGLTEDELEELYTVPFFIWTNYDSQEEEIGIRSLNFLSTLTLKRAGIALPPYQQFLSDMMEKVPAINARGYYSNTEGCFLHVEDAAGEEAQWIRNYEILQYNNMFDKKNKSELFFPYIVN